MHNCVQAFAVLFALFLPPAFDCLSSDARRCVLQYIYESESVPALCFGAILAVLEFAPALLTPAFLDHMNIFFQAIWAWKYMTMDDVDWHNKTWIFAQRQCQTLLCGNARLSICLQWAVSAIGITRAVLTSDYESFGEAFYVTDIRYELLSNGILLIVTITCDLCRWAEAKARVEQRRSANTTHLVSSLLDSMCEAVLRLDAELRLTEPCPRLAAILLRQGRLPAGTSLCDLMSADDAERLRSCLQGVEGEASAAHLERAAALHVHLKDGINQRYPVEIFSGCVLDEDDRPVYLIGVNEDRERPDLWDSQVVPLGGRSAAQPRLSPLPESSRVDHESASSEGGSSLPVSERGDEFDDEDGVALVWVDASHKKLPVLGHSNAFALLGGTHGPCKNLREWLEADEMDELRGWLRDDFAPFLVTSVRLTPPGAQGRFRAQCTLVGSPDNPPAAPPGARAVCIRLSQLTFRAARPATHTHRSHEATAALVRRAGGGASPASGDEASPASGGWAQQASGGGAEQAGGGAPPAGGAGGLQL